MLARRLADPAVNGEPWLPDGVPADPERGWYITIDEVEDAAAVARVTPWPVVDERRRLRFPDRRRGFIVGADAERLAALADRSRERRRALRTGDVFWAVVNRPRRLTDRTDLTDIVVPPLLDVTVPAREAAKTQYFAAVSAVLGADDVAQLYGDLIG
jgi:hypothetical protein